MDEIEVGRVGSAFQDGQTDRQYMATAKDVIE